jgi:hypothetical protein
VAGEGKRHFILGDIAQRHPYGKQGFGKEVQLPGRQRNAHGQKLLDELKALAEAEHEDEVEGMTIEFRSSPAFELLVKSLEIERSGIELLAVPPLEDGIQKAVVFVPFDKFKVLIKRVEDYLNPEKNSKKSNNARNKSLVESIDEIRQATVRSLWSDALEYFPADDQQIWMEVWLRDKVQNAAERFGTYAETNGLRVSSLILRFMDRAVVPVFCSPNQLNAALESLGLIAELRAVREPAYAFLQLDHPTQQQLVDDLLARLHTPVEAAPAVCLLDSGVLQGHRLLSPGLTPEDCLTFKEAWGTTDQGTGRPEHGTPMAGLALYGDVAAALMGTGPWALENRLESYKIIQPGDPHPPELYGAVTAQAVRTVEKHRQRDRIYSLTITAPQSIDRGAPSTWSSELDSLAQGGEADGTRRLFIVSVGNRPMQAAANYLDACGTSEVQDPGQAWNALTVGAVTFLSELRGAEYAGWTPVAPHGGLAPSSSTSTGWDHKRWPMKPELVVEGGNWAQSPGRDQVDAADSLSLLTTSGHPGSSLTATGDTSAATAQLARMAAVLQARYPELWPETIRGLLVHSARVHPGLRDQLGGNPRELLKWVGYGVPDLARASESAANAAVMVIQDSLKPFEEAEGRCKLNEMALFPLPWPVEALNEMGARDVTLRVTLSHFIEPNPARRGYRNSYNYASCGLRFAVKRPEENEALFLKRINQLAREEDEELDFPDDPDWVLKAQSQAKGSLHSDWITQSATSIAARASMAVYPVGGWWKERRKLKRHENSQRFSLIVSLETPAEGVDLYAAIASKIKTKVPVTIETK